jgi:hypothetical protein
MQNRLAQVIEQDLAEKFNSGDGAPMAMDSGHRGNVAWLQLSTELSPPGPVERALVTITVEVVPHQ